MTHNIPKAIGRWLETGLETGSEDDRLTALKVANQFDVYRKTNYGKLVVCAFMDQVGLSLNKGSRYFDAYFSQGYASPRVANIQREIVRAVGDEIGVQIWIYEHLTGDSSIVALHDVDTTSVTAIGEPEHSLGTYDASMPYELVTGFKCSRSVDNLYHATLGILGKAALEV